MNNEIATQSTALSEPELLSVMESSLYPGASPASIKMVLGYCKAAGVDPLQKPVHIVPMWSSQTRSMRDVILPGINLYRIQAMRSGQCAGISEPEFGPDVTEKVGSRTMTYPAWCRVTVKRVVASGQIASFTATERWLENYAIKGGKERDESPNAMWTKRPYGQLGKCAQAQALRIAFPEFAGQYTAEEMEGKEIDNSQPAHVVVAEVVKPEPTPYPDTKFAQNFPKWAAAIRSGTHDVEYVINYAAQRGQPFTEAQEAQLKAVKAPSAEAEVEDARPAVTFAMVADALTRSRNRDALDVAGDLIGSVADAAQREELTEIFNTRLMDLSQEEAA